MTIAPEQRMYRMRLELRDVDPTGRPGRYTFIEGNAVPYGVFADLGPFLEAHAPDSFAQSTRAGTGKGLPLLLFHDQRSFPIGKSEQWKHEGGFLRGVWRLNDAPRSQEAAQAAADGDLVGMSVGFVPMRSSVERCEDWSGRDWNPELGPEHKDRWTREESRLVETSLTPAPVYQDAEVTRVRSFDVYEERSTYQGGRRFPDVEAWRDYLQELRSAQQS